MERRSSGAKEGTKGDSLGGKVKELSPKMVSELQGAERWIVRQDKEWAEKKMREREREGETAATCKTVNSFQCQGFIDCRGLPQCYREHFLG